MPTPTKNLKELKQTGTFQKHPGRYQARVAALEGFTPLGGPPAHLDEREQAAWDEIREKAAPGTLAQSDFVLVELAAKLLVKSRHDANFSPTDTRVLQSIANDLGMSPLKRGRVSPATEPKEENRFAALHAILNGATPPN